MHNHATLATPALRKKDNDVWELRLYVNDQTENSQRALHNLEKLCEEHLKGRYNIEVIDLLKDPRLARGDQILAVPTLVKKLPLPIRKLIGDLSNTERVLVKLGLDSKNDDFAKESRPAPMIPPRPG